MNVLFALLRTSLVVLLVLTTPVLAHEGHDHGETKGAAVQTSTPRLEAVGGPFELVALLRHGELLIYLDDSRTNEPIMDAAITVETPKGPVTAELSESLYRLSAPWADAGTHNLIFTVTQNDSTEILPGSLIVSPVTLQSSRISNWLADLWSCAWLLLVAGIAFAAAALWHRASRRQIAPLVFAFTVLLSASGSAGAHEGHDHEPGKNIVGAGGDLAQRLADGTLFVPKPTQRILAIRTMVTEISAHSKTLELPGRIFPDPNASGFVQASVSGRLSPPEGGFPKLGTVVKAGDVLAFVTPPFQAIDVSDIRQKAGELDGQIDIVARRVARYETLAKSGVVNKVALDDALAELKSLRERRFQLDKTRQESERLIAPVSGVIAASNAIAGQIAETNSVVFHIIDPAKLWVEALTFTLLPDGQPATALTGEGRKLKLSFQGAGLTDRSQAIPVHFAIEGKEQGLRVGQLVTVLAATGDQLKGVAIPRTAVLRAANGQHIVFEHTSPERFEPRIVRIEPLDAERVLLLDGLASGNRVVVQGAELINQIR